MSDVIAPPRTGSASVAEMDVDISSLRTVDNEVDCHPAGAGWTVDDVSSLPFHTMEGLEPRAPLACEARGYARGPRPAVLIEGL
jgi:hypothetical protein